MKGEQKVIDRSWFERQLHELLPLLLRKTETPEGLYFPWFDYNWKRIDREGGTLVSQTRLIYNFAQAYHFTGESKYIEAVEKGARFLIERFRDVKRGGYFYSVTPNGRVLNSHKDSYGHSFVLFGLSHAFRVTGQLEFREEAEETWGVIQERMLDDLGGLHLRMDRDFIPIENRRSQNPLMHLFEALLDLSENEGMKGYINDARRIANFVLNRLVRSNDNLLPEFYDNNWVEASEPDGGNVDVGHAFEWAFLLSRAVDLGFPESYSETAENFLKNGIRMGFDEEGGGIFSPASPDGQSVRKIKGWWEQCEAIRCLLHFLVHRDKGDLLHPLERTICFVQNSMLDHRYKGWYTSLYPGENPARQAKMLPGKVYYHVVGMSVEALRLLDRNH
ncbi:AGE family epimerase/isomerase [Acidobacteriota bacterium]